MSVWTLAIATPTSSRFDFSKNGNAALVIDELATASLNLWAQEHNYKKAKPCLGFSYQDFRHYYLTSGRYCCVFSSLKNFTPRNFPASLKSNPNMACASGAHPAQEASCKE